MFGCLSHTGCVQQVFISLSFLLSLSEYERAGLFSDIGKKAKDLLTKDYSSDQKLTVSTYSGTGVRLRDKKKNLTENRPLRLRMKRKMANEIGYVKDKQVHALTSTAVKKGGLSNGDLAAQYKHMNNIIDVKLDTESNIATTLTVTDILPSTKTIASFKLFDYNSGKLEVQYFHDHATLTTAIALKQSPVGDVSATFGTPSIYFGAEAGYDTTSGSFTKYTTGVNVTRSDSSASVILGDKGDNIRASYVHHLDQLKKSAAVGEITRKFSTTENPFTVGGSFAVDHLTQVKAKLNNNGKLGVLLQHEVVPKSLLTVSGEVDTKALDKHPKFGLAIALKP